MATDTITIQGSWSGQLNVGMLVTLIVNIQDNADGTLSATIDCPEQGLSDGKLDTIAFQNGSLSFEFKKAFATYEGSINQNGTEIVGTYASGGASFPLTLKRCMTVPEKAKRPQEPQSPYPYQVEDVAYENKAAGVTLAGTLTLPQSQGPFPTVLLIAGSGPCDRNESLMGHKPFMVLADHLTRQGIAVLRVDKRGVGASTGDYGAATSTDFASDVLAGVQYLKARQEIDSKRIGLIGHSEGGIIAPMVAAQSRDVAFIVLLAAPGVNGEEILYEQGALCQRAEGVPEDIIVRHIAVSRQAFAIIKKEADPKVAATQLAQLAKRHLETLPETQKLLTELAKRHDDQNLDQATATAQIEAGMRAMNTPWFRHFLMFDPASVLKNVTVPVLALNGERDLQVAPQQNLPAIAKALADAGNTDYTIIELPGLNHVLQTCTTGAVSEYAKIEETMSPVALQTISKWILKHVASPFQQPSGPYGVGAETYAIKASQQQNQSKDALQSRDLTIQCWYPTTKKPSTPTCPWAPKFAAFLEQHAEVFKQLELGKLRTYAQPNVPVSTDQASYPVILYSHGSSQMVGDNSSLCEELASHGYVVVGIDHPQEAIREFFSKGFPLYNEVKIRMVQDMEQEIIDAQCVLDYLEHLPANSILIGKLDLHNIGMAGHSFGGTVAVQLCRRDKRCRAAINMEGPLIGKDATTPFHKPLLFLLGSESWLSNPMTEEQIVQCFQTKENYLDAQQSYRAAIDTLASAAGDDARTVVIKGADHNAFVDLALIAQHSPIDMRSGSLDAQRTHEIMKAYVCAFFDKYLKGKTSVLLNEQKSMYSEV